MCVKDTKSDVGVDVCEKELRNSGLEIDCYSQKVHCEYS